jgi:hypothetical protein
VLFKRPSQCSPDELRRKVESLTIALLITLVLSAFTVGVSVSAAFEGIRYNKALLKQSMETVYLIREKAMPPK